MYVLNGVSPFFESIQKIYWFYQKHAKISEKHRALVMRTDFQVRITNHDILRLKCKIY